MLNINTPNTKDALNRHLLGLKGEILSKLFSASHNKKNKLNKKECKKLEDFIKINIDMILTGNLNELIKLNSDLKKLTSSTSKLKSALILIFDYKWFRSYKKNKYNGFKLSQNLSIETCPYCNRNYTTSTKINFKSKNIYPAFDHYLPQDEYTLLALSFHNLIPTCTICNTTKSNKDPLIENILFPYDSKDYTNKFNFKLLPKSYSCFTGRSDDFSINLKIDPTLTPNEIRKINNTIDFFDIKEIFEGNHKGLIKEIIRKSINYNKAFLKHLKNTFGFNENEIYNLIFESYFEDYKFKKRPFSKLKRDIFDDLKS